MRPTGAATAALGNATFGEVRVTPGFDLLAKHVVRVVAPIWRDGQKSEEAALAKAYKAALTAARFQGVKTIAFPAISTGAYAYPYETATRIALETCAAFASEDPSAFRQIVFCPFTVADGEVYTRLAATVLADP